MMQIEIGTPGGAGIRREPATVPTAQTPPAPSAGQLPVLPRQLSPRREPAPLR
jgi:hypothetical protein